MLHFDPARREYEDAAHSTAEIDDHFCADPDHFGDTFANDGTETGPDPANDNPPMTPLAFDPEWPLDMGSLDCFDCFSCIRRPSCPAALDENADCPLGSGEIDDPPMTNVPLDDDAEVPF